MMLVTVMLLKKLIKNCPEKLENIFIKGLSSDTRNLKKGELFFAIPNKNFSVEKLIYLAKKKRAAAIVTSRKGQKFEKIISIRNVKKVLADTCKKFFSEKPKNIIAVTGTNGKSSVADFFYQILKLNNIKCATIGTLGIKKGAGFEKTNLTSLDIISFHKELQKIKKLKIDNVLVEASSHGLDQGRLGGVKFRGGIFTNFSQDHLDYHKKMRDYLNSKLILFKSLLQRNNYLITDKYIPEFRTLKKIAKKRKLKIKTINLKKSYDDLSKFKLIGDFQKKNLLMAIYASQIIGLKEKKIFGQLDKIRSVTGRLDLAKILPNMTKIFIDFAHTPEAIETAIKSLSLHFNRDITVVFGCGGERDKKKRAEMGKIANKYCNKIYITDDNPRNENPKKIRHSITRLINKKKLIEIGNRFKAIKHCLRNSSQNEIILIAGKGHESEQNYGKRVVKLSDYQILRKINVKTKNFLKKKSNILKNKAIIQTLTKKNCNRGFLGVSINSKTLKKNNMFIAIKGKNDDGHKYLEEALKKGASYCVVSDKKRKEKNRKLIKVSNTKSFLNKLAFLKREKSNTKIIAITGSTGKTTVKDLLGNLLQNYGKTFYSQKSYNNHFGVPLSLGNLEEDHKFGVFEIGMSKSGEINRLSKLVKPHIGVITNVAEAHIENFKNIKKIAEAKGEIIDNISEGGCLITYRDDNFYNFFKSKAYKKRIKVFSFGLNKNADVYPLKIKKKFGKIYLKVKVFNQIHKFFSKGHHVSNILSALTVLAIMNLDIKKIYSTIKNINLVEGRGKIFKVNHKKKSFNFIDESYNANPLSMKESILRLSEIKDKKFKKYILLGDMLELGDKSSLLHQNLSKVINKSSIDKLFVHGKDIINTYKYVKKKKQGNILQEKSDFYETLIPILKKNDLLMIKGSNGTGLHRISKKILKGKNNAF